MRYTRPLALQIHKRGRLCTVAKITDFGDRRPILAVAWRGQQGTQEAISMPQAALDLARHLGVTDFYLRDDRRRVMYTCPLVLFERGRLGSDGERYIPVKWLKPVPWRDWRFAKDVVDLTPRVELAAKQLQLFEVTP